jgi:hypothetical protein
MAQEASDAAHVAQVSPAGKQDDGMHKRGGVHVRWRHAAQRVKVNQIPTHTHNLHVGMSSRLNNMQWSPPQLSQVLD